MSQPPPLCHVLDRRGLSALAQRIEVAVVRLHEPAVTWNHAKGELVRTQPLARMVLQTFTAHRRPDPAQVLLCLAADAAGVLSLVPTSPEAHATLPFLPVGMGMADALATIRAGELAVGTMHPGPPTVVDHGDGTRSPATHTLLLSRPAPGARPGPCLYLRVPDLPSDAALLPRTLSDTQRKRLEKLAATAPWQALPGPWHEPMRTLALLDSTGGVHPPLPPPSAIAPETLAEVALRLHALGAGPVFDSVPSSQVPVVSALADTPAAHWLLCRVLLALCTEAFDGDRHMPHLPGMEERLPVALGLCGWVLRDDGTWARDLGKTRLPLTGTRCAASERLVHVLHLCRHDGPFSPEARWDSLIEATHLLRPDLLDASFLPGIRGSKGYPLFREAFATPDLPASDPLPIGKLPRHHGVVLQLRGIGRSRLSQLARALHHTLSRALDRAPVRAGRAAGPDPPLVDGLDDLQRLFPTGG